MKKISRKMVALLLIMLTVTTCGAFSVFATDDSIVDPKVTVTGFQDGDTVTAYQFITWDSANNQWKVAEGLSLTLADITDGLTKEELGSLASNTSSMTPVTDGTLNAGTWEKTCGTIETAGFYLILVTSNSVDYVYNPAVVSADFDGTNVAAVELTEDSSYIKKQKVDVVKVADNGTDDYDVQVGDIVPFTVTVTVPQYNSNWKEPYFAVSDKLSTGLTIDTVQTIKGLTEGTDYTITQGIDGFTIQFTEAYLKNKPSATVAIKYTALVGDALVGEEVKDTAQVHEETNKVTLEFSHDPTNTSSHKTVDDETHHYTFAIDATRLGQGSTKTNELIKVGVDKNGNPITTYKEGETLPTGVSPLAGAEFTLTGVGANNTGTVELTATSDADGRIFFNNLEVGTYTLKETKAPAGFIKDTTEHTVVISAAYNPDTTLQSYTITIDGKNTSTYTATTNAQNVTTYEAPADGNYSFPINNIAPATLTDVSVAQNGTLTYTGSAQIPQVTTAATAKGGQTVTFTYSKTQDGEYSSTVPTVTNVADGGTFYYKASAPNHEDATGSFTVTVNPATLTNVSVAQNETLTYTGSAQTPQVTTAATAVNDQPVTFKYSKTENGEYSSTVPTVTDVADSGTFYYKASAPNHEDATGSFTVTVNPATLTNVSVEQSGTLTYTGSEQTPQVTTAATAVNSQTVTFTYSKTQNGEYSSTVPTVTDVADGGTFYYKASAPNHADATGHFEVTVKPATLTNVSVEQNGTLTYTGSAQTPQVTTAATAVNDQQVTFTYSKTQDGEYSSTVPTVTNVADGDTFYYKASAPNHADTTGSFTVTVNKGTPPTVNVPTPEAVTYDPAKKLSDITLTGGWAWVDGTIVPTVGNEGYPAALTVDDGNYEYTDVEGYNAQGHTETRTVSLTVNKATPTVTVPRPEAVTYDSAKKLSDITLTGGWVWVDGTTVPTVSNSGYSATLTVDDANYDYTGVEGYDSETSTVTRSISLTVNKATPIVTVPTPAAVTYGQTLADVTLANPTGNMSGTWAWVDGKQSVGNAGTNTFKANFTPTDMANYNSVSNVEVAVTVNKADPIANAPTGLTATYGQTLADVSLTNPTGNTSGTWAWVDGKQSVGNAGTNTFKANFTPTDSANYNTVSDVDVTVTVNKAESFSETIKTVEVQIGDEVAASVNLKAYLGENAQISKPIQSGNVTGIQFISLEMKDDNYTLSFEAKSESGGTANIVLTAETNNYKTYTLTIPVEAKAKTTEVKLETTDETEVQGVQVEGLDTFTESQTGTSVKVVLGVTPIENGSESMNNAIGQLFSGVESSDPETVKKKYLNISIEKIVNSGNPTLVSDVGRVIEIIVKYDLTGKYNTVVLREHGGSIKKFTLLSSKPESGWTDGTFYVDTANSKIYIYTGFFSTYAIAYANTQSYTVTFDANGGRDVDPIVVSNRGVIHSLPTPTRSGYIFGGWYKGNTKWTTDLPVTENVSLVASWSRQGGGTGGSVYKPATVTFSVVNGAWDDGKTTSRTVTTTRLSSSDIPAVGNMPDEGYMAGSWNKTPGTSTSITGAINYIYTYAEKPIPSIITEPTAKVLTEDGIEQELIIPGTAAGGTLQYTLGASDGTYSSTIPKASEAGTYYVWYKVKGDADHRDTDPTSIEVTIKENTKPAATITKAPEGKDLTANGEAQELVTAGEVNGGTMEYGVGIITPTTWSSSIPTATAAGTYTVWYRARGDEEHSNSAVQSIVVTVKYGTNTLVYNGEEQDLVIAGSAEGGTMLYALGTDDVTPPEGNWTETVPTAKDPGTYYVWYKVEGDENHNDVPPVCIKVTIVPDTQVQAFEEGMKTLPEEVTRDDEELVEALRKMYDGLTDDQKSQIPEEDVKKLENAERELAQLKAEDQGKADAVATLIDQLPDNAKPENKTAVDAVLKQYEALTDEQKALIPAAEKEKIEALKAAFAGPSEEDQAVVTQFTEAVSAVPGNKAGEGKALVDNMTEMLSSMTEEQKALIPESTMAAYQEAIDAFKPGRKFCSGEGYYKVLSNGDVTYHHPADETITSAVVPNQVKKGKFLFKVIKISNYAFDGCENLEWIVIHRNIRVIGEDAFNGTAALSKINIKGSGIVSGKVTDAFEGAGKNSRLTVKVPKNKVNEYSELFTGEGGLKGSVKAA